MNAKICPHGCLQGLCSQCDSAKAPVSKPYTDHRLQTPKRTQIDYLDLIIKLDGVTAIKWITNQEDWLYYGNGLIAKFGPAFLVTVDVIHPLYRGTLIFKVDTLKQIHDTLKEILV